MLLVLLLLSSANSYRLPGSCEPGHFYEPSLMDCLACAANASLVTSADGFGCSCEEHSVRVGIMRCRPCNITEVVTSDGMSCVPRRCQSSVGRISCRKCPRDYISVTQNFDGSPMKEVQCIKCSRGYKAVGNRCERCEACSCNKNEIAVKGNCIPKKYVVDRPKYTVNHLHPDELLEIVKLEYLCTQQNIRACRALASSCVRNFYAPELPGPCRLWIKPKLINLKGLPLLTIDSTKYKTEFSLERGQDTLNIVMGKHTFNGGFQIITDPLHAPRTCLPPIEIRVGEYLSRSCVYNITELPSSEYTNTFELYLLAEKKLTPLSISLQKPNGYYVKKHVWSTSNFRKFFFINKYLSTITNTTNTVYLRTLHLLLTVKRDKSKVGYLQLRLTVDAQYATPDSDMVTTLLIVGHDMPNAGVLQGLQIWGGVLGALMVLYSLVQYRGVIRRGGSYIAIVPIIGSAVADALHFALILSTLHALASEAGTLGLTLPLSKAEEQITEALIYACVLLKCFKIIWINWMQCRYDIFFLDWSKYNPNIEETQTKDNSNQWKTDLLTREWMSLQTQRRVSPGYTITITLLVLHILSPWQSTIPISQGYKWSIAVTTWWCSYTALLCTQFLIDKLVEPHWIRLIKVCTNLEMSLLVFEEEFYAHYVNGRNEDSMDLMAMTNPISSCRVICAPQLRTVYNKIATTGSLALSMNFPDSIYRLVKKGVLTDGDSNCKLMNQFLAAFFERALDGLSWVASERTIMEKLFDVEFVAREGGNTSVLLYDANLTTPSCFAVTWWGEEWQLATFDIMLFGCILIATDHTLLAALITLIVWKVVKFTRMCAGKWNVQRKTNLMN